MVTMIMAPQQLAHPMAQMPQQMTQQIQLAPQMTQQIAPQMPVFVMPQAVGTHYQAAPAMMPAMAPVYPTMMPTMAPVCATSAPMMVVAVSTGASTPAVVQPVVRSLSLPEKPPCTHNNWEDLRTRRGRRILRCAECKLKWRCEISSQVYKICPDNETGDCRRGAQCNKIHVFASHRWGRCPALACKADDAQQEKMSQ
eukprot:Hpha_TRINITY_DN16012_c2_g4::TRINITY_DN16012_c2_g4_i1::g.120078::m.120078